MSFAKLVSSWWNSALSFMGFTWHLRRGTIVVVGLDNAGKTTLLHVLKENGKVLAHEPTRHPGQEEITIGGMKLNAFDMGGHQAARRLWVQYLDAESNASIGVVFVVDARDMGRFDEARAELVALMTSVRDAQIPIAVLGNKIDAPPSGLGALAVGEHQLRMALGLPQEDASSSSRYPCELFMCSVVARVGLQEPFEWLASRMK